MSGRKLENGIYNVTTDWENETESKSILKYGLDNLDFSEMNTTVIPQILAGSSIDVDGVFYRFDGNEAITGAPSDGTIYVIITGGATAIASFTNTALPSYDFSRQGYYGVGGERYVLKITKSGASYSNKIQLSKNYFGRDTEFSGNITQLSGLASLIALTVAGNITQIAGVTSLKTTTINNAVSALSGLGVKNGVNGLYFWVDGSNTRRIDANQLGDELLSLNGGGGGNVLIKTLVNNGIDALQVAGSIYSSATIQALTVLYAGSLTNTRTQIGSSVINMGLGRTVDGNAIFDLIGDTTYTDYGARLIRFSGENGESLLAHRGTGQLTVQSLENSTIALKGVANYATFSNTAIDLKKNTAITGFLNTSSYGLFGGAIYDGINNLNVLGDGKISGVLTANSVNTGYGDNNVVPEDVYFDETRFSSLGTELTLADIDIKQTGIKTIYKLPLGSSSTDILLPATGTYSYTYSKTTSSNSTTYSSEAFTASGTVIESLTTNDRIQVFYRRLT